MESGLVRNTQEEQKSGNRNICHLLKIEEWKDQYDDGLFPKIYINGELKTWYFPHLQSSHIEHMK